MLANCGMKFISVVIATVSGTKAPSVRDRGQDKEFRDCPRRFGTLGNYVIHAYVAIAIVNRAGLTCRSVAGT